MDRPAIEVLPLSFSVCRLNEMPADLAAIPFCFFALTDSELSLVCPTAAVPNDLSAREDHWRAFRVAGPLAFSLTGILAGIADVLTKEKISLFAVSTFDTDYILTREEAFPRALSALRLAGYPIPGDE